MPTRTRVKIEDIDDAEAFVRSLLPRNALLSSEMREDLVQEGLKILAELERRYEPGRNGQDPAGSRFSGFAARFLPAKLRDAWHRLEGHTLSTDPKSGKRQWSYPQKPASLDELTEREGGVDGVRALQDSDVYESDLAASLARAFDEQHEEDREISVKVGVLLGEGLAPAAVAERLGVREREVVAAMAWIKRVSWRFDMVEASG